MVGQNWRGLIELHLDKFGKRRPTSFHIYGVSVIHVSKCHLHSWKIILSCCVAMILQMKDSWILLVR